MIALNDTEDTIVMIVVAAAVGAFAGLGAFALQSKRAADKDTKLGWLASMLVGALASVGVLYFLSPVAKTAVTLPGGSVTTTSQYDLLKLASLSVIVGSGGRVFLTSLQARAGALLSQQTSSNVVAEAPKALTDAQAKIGADAESAKSAIGPLAARLQELAATAGAPEEVKEAAITLDAAQDQISKVADQAQTHLEEVQGRIDAAAGETGSSSSSGAGAGGT
jgi:hypothetical protein